MYYIGIMSGTSLDGIDTVIADISENHCQLIAQHYQAYSPELRLQISTLSQQAQGTLDQIAQLDQQLGQLYGQAVNQLLAGAQIDKSQIKAIGCHGQTIRHSVKTDSSNENTTESNYSWQLGDANQITEITGITTVADFRRRDIAAGGEGAPLAPAFHLAAFALANKQGNRQNQKQDNKQSQILNLGGIANITLLDSEKQTAQGFDIGPANCLMDEWVQTNWQQDYDQDGLLAKQGQVDNELVNKWLAHPAFKHFLNQLPPKSTGRELFNLAELNSICDLTKFNAHDVLASLVEFTAICVQSAVNNFTANNIDIYVCGGGAHNKFLLDRIQQLLPNLKVSSTEVLGIHPDWVEAAAFAWLAFRTINHLSGNLPAVTGASGERILGAVYPGSLNS